MRGGVGGRSCKVRSYHYDKNPDGSPKTYNRTGEAECRAASAGLVPSAHGAQRPPRERQGDQFFLWFPL
jgi:hypothetical protein